MHRMVWSFLFLLPLIFVMRQWDDLKTVLKNRRRLAILLVTTILIASNWFVFIWAINHDRILETSLGYYISPLINVVLGMVFLKERLRPAQLTAVLLAAVGVFYLTWEIGRLPWIALFLAVSFGTLLLSEILSIAGSLQKIVNS